MRPDALRLARRLEAALGTPVLVETSAAPARLAALRPRERTLYRREVQGTARDISWRRGRAALRRLLRRIGAEDETAALRFPHARISLSHGGGLAIAVYVPGSHGVGVDLEQRRRLPEGSERFFLDDTERRFLESLPARERAGERLRLWTVKEAVFKANLENEGTVVGDYRTVVPAARAGLAEGRGFSCRYASVPFAHGFVSVALGGLRC
jgi:4'-phosphopantetheinyl transferase EntD